MALDAGVDAADGLDFTRRVGDAIDPARVGVWGCELAHFGHEEEFYDWAGDPCGLRWISCSRSFLLFWEERIAVLLDDGEACRGWGLACDRGGIGRWVGYIKVVEFLAVR